MKRSFEKYLKGVFLTSMASLVYPSDIQASPISFLNDYNSDDSEVRNALGNDNKQKKFVLKMNNDDSYLIAAHRSHSSHRSHFSHRSHSSHRSSSGSGSYSQPASTSRSSTSTYQTTTPRVYSLGERVISVGASGGDVKELAEHLIRHGFLNREHIVIVGSNATCNTHMETAIKNFQRECGLTVDGKAGSTTITHIRNYTPPVAEDVSKINLGDRVLQKGMTGSDVTQLKNILIDKEYLSGELVKGIATFDQSIHDAVVAFQRAIGIDADGIVNAQTVYFLKKQDD